MAEPKLRKMNITQKLNLIIIAVIVIGSILYYWNKDPAASVVFDFGEEVMTLTGPEGAPFSVEVKYTDILSVSETTDLDIGTNLTGICTEECWFGTWRNDAYGEYTLCASPAFSDYIVLTTTSGVVVCNYENADTTQQLYIALLELLETKA